jgi:flagellar biosynthesis protein FliQ
MERDISGFSNLSDNFDKMIKDSSLINNPYVMTILFVITVSYASLVAPKLPSYIQSLFDNTLFRLACLFLILALTEKQNPALGFLVAIVFMLTITIINKNIPEEENEKFTNTVVEKFKKVIGY